MNKLLLFNLMLLISTTILAQKKTAVSNNPTPISTATGEQVCPAGYNLEFNNCNKYADPELEKALENESQDQEKLKQAAQYKAAQIYNKKSLQEQSKDTIVLLESIKPSNEHDAKTRDLNALAFMELQKMLQDELNKLSSESLNSEPTDNKNLVDLVAKVEQFNKDLNSFNKSLGDNKISGIYICPNLLKQPTNDL
jgi:hypothetical protein